MSSSRKTYDTDSIILRKIVARTEGDLSIDAGKVLVAQGDGSTQWVYPSTLPGAPAFTRVIGNGTNIVADNLSTTLVLSTLDSMGMIANSTTKQISFYAKAFTSFDVSGGNTVRAYNTTNNTLTPTVQFVGLNGVQISSDPQTNRMYFQTAPATLSTGVYAYHQVNVLSNAPSTITDNNFSNGNTYLTSTSPSTVFQLVGLGDITLQTDVTNNVAYIGISTFTTSNYQAISTTTGTSASTIASISTTNSSAVSTVWYSTQQAFISTNNQYQYNFNYINSFYTPLNDFQDLSTFTNSTLANTSLSSTFSTTYISSAFITNGNISTVEISSLTTNSGILSTAAISSLHGRVGVISALTVSSLSGINFGGDFSTSLVYVQGSNSVAEGYESFRYEPTTSTLLFGTDISNNSMKIDLVNKRFFAQSATTYPSLELGRYPNSSNYSNLYIDPTGISLTTDDITSIFTIQAKNITLDNPAGYTIHNSASTLTHHLMPEYSDVYDLGAPDLVWRDLYLSSGSIYMSTTKISLNSNGELQISIGGASNIPIGGVSSFASMYANNAYLSSITASSITAVNFVYLSSVQDSYYISTTNLDAEEISYSTCFGQTISTQSILASTLNGVKVSDYVSTGQLTSSVTELGAIGYISSTQLSSTITTLGTLGYISSATLVSTVSSLGEIGYISSTQLSSTITTLGTLGYVSTASLTSTVSSLGTIGYISSTQLSSTITTLGTVGYVSSTQLTSSITGLGTVGYVSSATLVSTVSSLGALGYVSTFTLTSSINGAVNNLGSLGYVSTSMLGNVSSLNTSSIQNINSRYDAIQIPGAMTLNNTLTGLVIGGITHVSTNAVKYAVTNGTLNVSSFSNATGIQYAAPLSTVIRSIAFNGKSWLMATSDTTPTNGRLYRSDNGVTWSQVIVQGNNSPLIVNKLIYASTFWYAVGSNNLNSNYTIARSTDGSNWTPATSGGFSGAGDSIAYNAASNRFVAVGHAYGAGVSTPVVRISDDMGSNWLNASFTATGVTAGTSVAYANNLWLAGFNRTTGSNLKYSTNGSNWTDVTTVHFPQTVTDITYGSSNWVAVGGSNFSTIRYSGNGSNWSNTTNQFIFGGKGVVWTGSLFAAVGADATSTAKVKYSSDGITWVDSINADFSGEGDSIAYASNATLPTYTLDVSQGARLNTLDVPGSANVSSLVVSSITHARSGVISSFVVSSIGINTTTPGAILDVAGTMRVGPQTGNISSFNINLGSGGVGTTRSAYIFGDGKDFFLANQQSGTFGIDTGTGSFRILSNGFTGIGSTNPASQLEILGPNTAYTTTETGNIFFLGTGKTSGAQALYMGAFSTSTSNHSFIQSVKYGVATAPLYINGRGGNTILNASGSGSGVVGIGTTTPNTYYSIGTTHMLDVSGSVRSRTEFLCYNSTNNCQVSLNVGNGSYAVIEAFNYNNSVKQNVCLSPFGGNVGVAKANPSYYFEVGIDSAAKPGTNTWTISSDERLKTNISLANLDICYSSIKAIPLKRYTWRDDIYTPEQVPDRSKIGWIAQDVEQVFSKAVSYTSSFGYDDCRGLNTDQLYAVAYGATQKVIQIQEQHTNSIEQISTIHQTFEQRFSTLEGELRTTQSTCIGLQEEVSTLTRR